VQCAQQIQSRLRIHNAENAKDEQIHVRIGIHLGDIVQKDGDVFGDGVNIASRLQALADPDTLCISDMVYRDVAKKLDLGTVVSLGRPKLKNITERFHVYALLPKAPKGVRQQLQVQRLKFSRRMRPIMFVGVLVAGLIAVRYSPFPILGTRHSELNTQEAQPPLPLPDKPSIVVLPFTNMSNDPEQEYFSDGITEDITSDLSRLSSLFVIARNSAFTYKGKAVKVQDVSRELGVRYILEGSVRRSENQVRVTAQLVDATTGGHLWSERYDRPLTDIFALQDEIRQKIVLALKVKLTPEEQERFRQAPTDNLEAYDFYLRGLDVLFRGWTEGKKELNTQAQQMFEKAIELDSQYAGACAWLSWSYFLDWFNGWAKDRSQTLEQAFELAQRAVALNEFLSLPHQVLSRIVIWEKQHEQAITEGERAITLDPNDAENYVVLGAILTFSGRSKDGIKLIERAMRLNPQYPPTYLNLLGFAYRTAGQCEEAIVHSKKALTLGPGLWGARANLVYCYTELDRLKEARAELIELQRIFPNMSLERVKQSFPYKDPADLERLLSALRKAGLK
jgi:TolB-like protein